LRLFESKKRRDFFRETCLDFPLKAIFQKKALIFQQKKSSLRGVIRQVELTKVYKLTMMFGIGHKKAKFI
jgi:hypothetical protein